MIRLFAYDAQTFYEGPKWELQEHLFPLLRIEDEKYFWKEKFLLRKFAYFSDIEDEVERNKKIEQIREQVRYTKFYDGRSKSFLTGLLPKVLKKLRKNGIKFSLRDRRSPVADFNLDFKTLAFRDTVENRPEQLSVVKAALEKKRGILHCATNFGKTEVAAAIIAQYIRQKTPPRVLFLVHRVQLVNQTADRFRKHLDVPVSTIGGGSKEIKKNGILVATVQTASSLLGSSRFDKFLERCNILFIDEFHINKAWTCAKIAKACLAPMRFGLSGTIDEGNQIKMLHYKGMTGPIIASVRNEELVNLGRSARPFARFIEVNAETIPMRLKYVGAYRFGIVGNVVRNSLIVREVMRHLNKNRQRILVTVSRIAHGLILKKLLESRIDLPVEFLSGSSPIPVRKNVIEKFKRKKISVLIASPIFDTGVDIPEIDAWVNAAGGKGWELVLQRLGRVLRKKEGANRVYITDFVDLHNKYLMRHSLARIDHYQREKIVKIKIIGD